MEDFVVSLRPNGRPAQTDCPWLNVTKLPRSDDIGRPSLGSIRWLAIWDWLLYIFTTGPRSLTWPNSSWSHFYFVYLSLFILCITASSKRRRLRTECVIGNHVDFSCTGVVHPFFLSLLLLPNPFLIPFPIHPKWSCGVWFISMQLQMMYTVVSFPLPFVHIQTWWEGRLMCRSCVQIDRYRCTSYIITGTPPIIVTLIQAIMITERCC